MNNETLLTAIEEQWEKNILPTLSEYIAIPNVSPVFDPEWKKNGYMDKALNLLCSWVRAQKVEGLTLEVKELPGKTPVIYIEIEGSLSETVLLYGHMDKQPEGTGWNEGLSAWSPVRKEDKLYGRGSADDGYALFSALTAIKTLQEQGVSHPRSVILIEACEESGSYDLPAYIQELAPRIGAPKLIVCLDSGCGNYEQLWMTTSLRGIIAGELRVEILTEGVHSGKASGVVPSSFRIMRQLLSRIEDEKTGKILLPTFHLSLTEERKNAAQKVAEVLGDAVHADMPFVPGAFPMATDNTQLVLNGTWEPTLSIVGANGFPAIQNAGNVLRASTAFKISLRIPPHIDIPAAEKELRETLEKDPPYGAKVTLILEESGSGWEAPILADWLEKSIADSSESFFGKPALSMGEGGSIPFMAMLGNYFPEAQFLITGLLGPSSNPHGPNEFLHIPTAKRLTACIAKIVSEVPVS